MTQLQALKLWHLRCIRKAKTLGAVNVAATHRLALKEILRLEGVY